MPPFVGAIVYMLFRPPEYLDDVRERELEIKAMEERLAGAARQCPVCRAESRAVVPRLSRLHDALEAGLRQLQGAARGALADLPVLRDAGRVDPASSCRSSRRARGARRRSHAARRLRRPMAVEQTLVLVKPDAVRAIARRRDRRALRARGFGLRAARLVQVDRALADEHYAEHREKPFFGELVEFITSAPTLALVLEGEGAIASVRTTMGATNPPTRRPARSAATSRSAMPNNLVHGSDSPESAAREIALWFPDGLV